MNKFYEATVKKRRKPINLSSSYESGFVFDRLKRKSFELGLDAKAPGEAPHVTEGESLLSGELLSEPSSLVEKVPYFHFSMAAFLFLESRRTEIKGTAKIFSFTLKNFAYIFIKFF